MHCSTIAFFVLAEATCFFCGVNEIAAETNPRGAVATVHPLATEAGRRVLQSGGNAVDAAIAAAFTLGVVDCHNSGIGGGCFLVLRLQDGSLIAIDGRETAPRGIDRKLFMKQGKIVPERSRTGPLAVGTPGALAAYVYAAEKYGSLPLKNLLLPAADIAEHGFPIDATFARRIESERQDILRFAETGKILLRDDQTPYTAGETLKLPDLAKTYRAIAARGSDWFYRGPFARQVAAWMQQNNGVLDAEDFASYQAQQRKPLVSHYRGRTIVGFPPPSSGGVHVAQILNILSNFDLAGCSQVAFIHHTTEAMKRAFADRAFWLGDPAFTPVPTGLLSTDYAKSLAEKIDPEKSTVVKQHGNPPAAEEQIFGKHTTHIAAADNEGNWVALTTTVNTSFGSKIIVPGTGVILNNQMDDFSLAPGVPNAFGLIGAEANRIEPGKRPLSSMSPTIVLQDGKPILTLGAAGGPKIISQVVLTILRIVDRGMTLREAISAPRIHHQWRPDKLFIERATGKWSLPERGIKVLQRFGHTLVPLDYTGATQCVGYDNDGILIGIAEPRLP